MRLAAFVVAVFVCLCGYAQKEAQRKPAPKDPVQKFRSAVDKAVKKGVVWLLKHRNKDGSFSGIYHNSYGPGETALVLLALLKGGLSAKDPAIRAGFAWLCKNKPRYNYSAAITIMAIEALFAPSEEQCLQQAKSYDDLLRRRARRMKPPLRKLLQHCLDLIVASQTKTGFFTYASGRQSTGDLSNTQYSLLGLFSAWRMGVRVPREPVLKVCEALIKAQEPQGPQVNWFPVPAADFSFRKLQSLQKDFYRRLKGIPEKERARSKTTVVLDPYRDFSGERGKMFARGWGYTYVDFAKLDPKRRSSYLPRGSMTTAGVAGLVIAKALLENTRFWSKRLARTVNRGIRDGCAWLAKHFSVTANPGLSSSSHLHYYLYGLERAGVLALVLRFGSHHWYAEGAKRLISTQNSDGSWGSSGGVKRGNKMVCALHDTCFAILFLKRGTVPICGGVMRDVAETGASLFAKKDKPLKPGFSVKQTAKGVMVAKVEKGSPAEKAGLRVGDIIRGAFSRVVSDIKSFNAVMKKYLTEKTKYVTLIVERGDFIFQVTLRLKR